MKIKFVKEIPQWITSSDIAAYHPWTKTIWIRNNLGWKTIPILLHELSHWFIHKFLKNKEKLHNKIDEKYKAKADRLLKNKHLKDGNKSK
jgi:hypothetical protein